MNDEYFMKCAIECAKEAYNEGEVPVGAVVVYNGEIIARSHNRREMGKNAVCHAELSAISDACAARGGWRLFDCDLYVTMEPCPMCAGACVNARISRVVYGVRDKKAGAFGGVFDLNSYNLNHKPEIVSGVCEAECRALLRDFFARLREKKKGEKNDDAAR